MTLTNSHLEGPPHRLNANGSRQASEIDGINKKAVNEGSLNRVANSQIDGCIYVPFTGLGINDVSPIGITREKFVRLVVDHFIRSHTVKVPDSESDYSAQNEQDQVRKRNPLGVRFEGDPQFVLPLMYAENIYETLVKEVNVRLACLHGFHGETFGVDLQATEGLHGKLGRTYQEKGLFTFKRRRLATLGEARTKFPELVVQEEKGVRFVVVNGLDIVEKPSTMSVPEAEWFKRLTGRSEVSIASRDYKFYSPRHQYQGAVSNPFASMAGLPVGEAVETNSVAQTNVQTKQPAVQISLPIDHTKLYTTNLEFESSDETMAWVRRVGKANQTKIVKYRVTGTRSGKGNVRTFWMYCNRHRSVTKGKNKWNGGKEVSTSFKRCNCPFSLKCYRVDQGPWKVEVVCGMHNHKIGQNLHGFASQCKPKQTVPQINDKNGMHVNCSKKGNNARVNILQQFLSQTWVEKGFYFKRYRKAAGADGLGSDLVFAHADSLSLLRTFPYVLTVDATFQGNRFNVPFFEVLGISFTGQWFNVACAFVAAEREDNYVWALNQLKEICRLAGKTPTTIMTVTDPNQALLNAVEWVFPDTKHCLYRPHVFANIEDRCLKDMLGKSTAITFVNACKNLFESKTGKVYEEQLASMEAYWKSYQGLIGYLKQTWLTPYKEKIVSAWTDKMMHLDLHAANRSLSAVKQLLNFFNANFDNLWGKLHSLLNSQMIYMNFSLLQSHQLLLGIIPRVEAFKLMYYGVAHTAVEMMARDYIFVMSGNQYPSTCICQRRVTHGLPCFHEIAKYVADHRPIPHNAIHQFWRQLTIKLNQDDSNISMTKDLWEDNSRKRVTCGPLLDQTPHGQSTFGSSSSETSGLGQSGGRVTSPTSNGQGRSCPVQSIERPKPSNKLYVEEPYIHEIPNFMVPYVTDFCEYVANGHCGFQAIAEGVEYAENGWRRVRGDLFKELASHSDVYVPLFIRDRFQKIQKSLAVWTLDAGPDQRFSYPDMGHIVATHYQLVFVVLGQQCVTFLPLYADDEAQLSDMNELCLVALHQGRRFISVTMDEGFPLPPIHPLWVRHHHRSVDGLDHRYGDRFQKFTGFQSFMGPSPSL